MTEAMDLDGLRDVLDRVERGEIRFHAKDTTEPSPFAHEMVNSKPYTFLDDAPLEERRARAVTLRRTLPQSGKDLGILDPDAIELVVAEAQPQPRDPEEVHDALLNLIAVRPEYMPEWQPWFGELVAQKRAATVETPAGERLWFAAESLPAIEALYPNAAIDPPLILPPELTRETDEHNARVGIVRGYLELLGPTTVAEIAERTALEPIAVEGALAFLENENGGAIRGKFRPLAEGEEWCDRRLLARIHRYTLDRLRSEIEPVSAQDLMRFLLRWQHVAPGAQVEGKRGLLESVAQLQGFDIPAVAWERHILPARVSDYSGSWLDELCIGGDVAWARLNGKKGGDSNRAASANSATPISLTRRPDLGWLAAGVRGIPSGLGVAQGPSPEQARGSGSQPDNGVAEGTHPSDLGPRPARGAPAEIHQLLQARGALFYDDIVAHTRRLPTDVERGLWDLVARGLATADAFQALRSLMASSKKRNFRRPQRARLFRTLSVSGTPSGRWSLLPEISAHPEPVEGHSSPAETEPPMPIGEAEVGARNGDERAGRAKTDREHPRQRLERERDLAADRQLLIEDLAEAWAEQLLFRYGVVFRDLTRLENISIPWREILRALRRMEAQGTVRGGRFIAGFYGEQYARPEAVEALRATRRQPKTGELTRISAVDPLNLTGIVTPGPRIPSVHTKTVYYRDGLPITEEEYAVSMAERHLAGTG
jgi:ATP-dependent Lhr-like helicase